MGDYTNMADYYDVIMTSGYYDYAKIVDSLVSHHPERNVLEIGCGTGLILEELAKRQPQLPITGIDLTAPMLKIAQKRLAPFSTISLSQQNITELSLNDTHELAFSYGGVWYFVIDGDKEPFLVSHIADDRANHLGFEHLAKHMAKDGTLLLGIQGPHHDYETVISNGMRYSQKIDPTDIGFTKHYYLHDGEQKLMDQTVHYRTYNFDEAKALMGAYGFEYVPERDRHQLFLQFKKVV
ncbi:MAG: class I SAM-dependent methyltransferase [Limnohabitans sp.]|nr:class I SAM-dependent methyltransferase [Limnohabitans sp.]